MTENDRSSEFQQRMCNYFGDRDYNNFDHDELDEYLLNQIAFALYGHPASEDGYDEEQKKKSHFLWEVIIKENNLVRKRKDKVTISFIFNYLELENDNYSHVPLFVLRKCKGNSHDPCRVFIDHVGRVYQTWSEYLTENKLPKCRMILPKTGRYLTDNDKRVILEKHKSPACGINKKILLGTDIATGVGGLASVGLLVAASVVVVAPVALITAGVASAVIGGYSIGRSAYTIHDRRMRKETLNIANSEVRGAYLTFVAGSLSFVGAGVTMTATQLAARGVTIGNSAKAAVNAVNIANLSTSGIALANNAYDVLSPWINEKEPPSVLAMVQLSSSLLFFGHAVYSFQMANTLTSKAQQSALKEFNDSLSSNRQRRTFNKLILETIRQNDGDVTKGQAVVIKTLQIHNQNKNEIFATLTRYNKDMNKNNVRFAMNNGEITLNGVAVDVTKFGSMKNKQVVTYLKKLPDVPNPTQADFKIIVNTRFEGIITVSNIAKFSLVAFSILRNADKTVSEKIVGAVAALHQELTGNPLYHPVVKILDLIFPDHLKYIKLLDMVLQHFQKLVNVVEEKYQQWLKTKTPDYEEPYFVPLSLNFAKRSVEIFQIVTKTYFILTNLTEIGLKILIEHLYIWTSEKFSAYQENKKRKEKRAQHSDLPARVDCCKCGGYYYTR